MISTLAIVYYGLGWYLDYKKWYIKYENGRTSRGFLSKKKALKRAQCFDGLYIFSIVKVFGKSYKFICHVHENINVKAD